MYKLLLSDEEINHIKQALTTLECIDTELEISQEWLKNRFRISRGIINQIDTIKLNKNEKCDEDNCPFNNCNGCSYKDN